MYRYIRADLAKFNELTSAQQDQAVDFVVDNPNWCDLNGLNEHFNLCMDEYYQMEIDELTFDFESSTGILVNQDEIKFERARDEFDLSHECGNIFQPEEYTDGGDYDYTLIIENDPDDSHIDVYEQGAFIDNIHIDAGNLDNGDYSIFVQDYSRDRDVQNYLASIAKDISYAIQKAQKYVRDICDLAKWVDEEVPDYYFIADYLRNFDYSFDVEDGKVVDIL